jgi:hypothetical protein
LEKGGIMFRKDEIPVAYSMVKLAQLSAKIVAPPFPEFMCYWTAFNNIYTTIAERAGYSADFRYRKDRTICERENGSVLIPQVEPALKERDEIGLVLNEFSEALKRKLIDHPSTKFFVSRIPKWRGHNIEFDVKRQKLNGVINVKYTIDDKHPVWSPVDFGAYERYVQGNATPNDVNLLVRQLIFLLYTVRNNTFHGGKRADDADNRKVIVMALPLLKMIVESFMRRAG